MSLPTYSRPASIFTSALSNSNCPPPLTSERPQLSPSLLALSGISKLTKEELRRELDKEGVLYGASARKPELQAMLSVYYLGFTEKSGGSDPDVLISVIEWCKLLLQNLKNECCEKGISGEGTRWQLIDRLIRYKFSNEVVKHEDIDTDETSDDDMDVEWEDVCPLPSPIPSPTYRPAVPHHSVMNVLVSSIFSHVAVTGNLAVAAPGCPFPTRANILFVLNKLPRFDSQAVVENILNLGTASDCGKMISWICCTFGDHIAPATGEFKIPGFHAKVQQFIVKQPDSALQAKFDICMKQANQKSIVLFHGTPFVNLRSILATGFDASSDRKFGLGVFLAERPRMSYQFAGRGSWVPAFAYRGETGYAWVNSPFGGCGLLLGCEVAGKGRVQPDKSNGPGIVHVIKKLDTVMARYLFVLPGYQIGHDSGYGAHTAPTREKVLRPMEIGI